MAMKQLTFYEFFLLMIATTALTIYGYSQLSFFQFNPATFSSYEIIYDNLTYSEVRTLKVIMGTVDERYLTRVKTITFTKSQQVLCGRESGCENFCVNGICGGLNDQRGNILINVKDLDRGRTYSIKNYLCHELNHNWIPTKSNNITKDVAHQIVDDLARKGVCYN